MKKKLTENKSIVKIFKLYFKKAFIYIFFITVLGISTIKNKDGFMRLDKIRYNFYVRRFGTFLNNLPEYEHTYITNKTIFWSYLQGTDFAPKIALANLNSIKVNLKDYNIIILNNSNFDQYVKMPNYFLEKYKNGTITFTLFSDFLRLELILKYGGTWIDSSVLITGYDSRFYNNILFFFGEHSRGCVGSTWFMTGEKGSPILRTTLDLLYEYWRRYDKALHYFTIHFFIKMACSRYKTDFKNMLYVSNKYPHQLRWEMSKKFNEKKYNKLLKKATVHKLSIHLKYKENNTFYQHILDEYYHE